MFYAEQIVGSIFRFSLIYADLYSKYTVDQYYQKFNIFKYKNPIIELFSHLSHFGILLKKWKSCLAFQYFPDLNVKYFLSHIQTWSRHFFKRLHSISVKKSTFLNLGLTIDTSIWTALKFLWKTKVTFSLDSRQGALASSWPSTFHYLLLAFFFFSFYLLSFSSDKINWHRATPPLFIILCWLLSLAGQSKPLLKRKTRNYIAEQDTNTQLLWGNIYIHKFLEIIFIFTNVSISKSLNKCWNLPFWKTVGYWNEFLTNVQIYQMFIKCSN